MKRVLLALLAGVAFPFLYSITAGPLSTYTENLTIQQLLYLPIGWPRLILQRLVPLNSFPFRDQDGTALLVYMIVCDVALYSFLAYFLLWRRSTRRRAQSRLPPHPPDFEGSGK